MGIVSLFGDMHDDNDNYIGNSHDGTYGYIDMEIINGPIDSEYERKVRELREDATVPRGTVGKLLEDIGHFYDWTPVVNGERFITEKDIAHIRSKLPILPKKTES